MMGVMLAGTVSLVLKAFLCSSYFLIVTMLCVTAIKLRKKRIYFNFFAPTSSMKRGLKSKKNHP